MSQTTVGTGPAGPGKSDVAQGPAAGIVRGAALIASLTMLAKLTSSD